MKPSLLQILAAALSFYCVLGHAQENCYSYPASGPSRSACEARNMDRARESIRLDEEKKARKLDEWNAMRRESQLEQQRKELEVNQRDIQLRQKAQSDDVKREKMAAEVLPIMLALQGAMEAIKTPNCDKTRTLLDEAKLRFSLAISLKSDAKGQETVDGISDLLLTSQVGYLTNCGKKSERLTKIRNYLDQESRNGNTSATAMLAGINEGGKKKEQEQAQAPVEAINGYSRCNSNAELRLILSKWRTHCLDMKKCEIDGVDLTRVEIDNSRKPAFLVWRHGGDGCGMAGCPMELMIEGPSNNWACLASSYSIQVEKTSTNGYKDVALWRRSTEEGGIMGRSQKFVWSGRKYKAQGNSVPTDLAGNPISPREEQQNALAKETAEMRLGKVFKDCTTCPEMVIIPAGSFEMGGTDSDEKPVHRVTLKGFAMGKTEVTQGQWRSVMGNNPSHFSSCGDDCPVEMVSWNEVKTFIQRLNAKTGKSYRLPSEAEWEYACRAGGTHTYCGSENVDSVAWWQYSSDTGNKTHAAAGKQANAWGLYDMSGNVWEWTEDCWNANYSGAPSDGSAWTRGNCGQRVVRGGSWYYLPSYSRSASRDGDVTTIRSYVNGFRLARMLP